MKGWALDLGTTNPFASPPRSRWTASAPVRAIAPFKDAMARNGDKDVERAVRQAIAEIQSRIQGAPARSAVPMRGRRMSPRFFLGRQLILAICLCSSAGALAQTTAFTYQGRLTDNALAPTAIYDMQFKLYDSADVQVGLPVTIATVQVTNGLFTVQINAAGEFGPNAFTGPDRFLEVSVRHPGDPAYTPLTPKQQLTSAPYAVRSNEAAKAASFTAPLAGDVTGNQDATTVTRINGSPLGSTTGATSGQVLTWNGSSWAKNNPAGVGGSGTLNLLPKFTGGATIGNSSLTDNGSTVDTNLSFRAPIFYDLSNTGYYVDPASTSNTNVLRFNSADCLNGFCPANGAIRFTPNFHLNAPNPNAIILNWDNGAPAAGTQQLRIGNGASQDAFYVTANGNITFGVNGGTFSNPNPTLTTISGSYWTSPSGAFFNSGTVFFAAQSQHRGGVNNDQGTLTLGASNSVVNLSGAELRMNNNTAIDAGSGWHRTYGNTGWYNGTYAGGWYMIDTSWIRSYNSKKVYIDTVLRADGGVTAGALEPGPGKVAGAQFVDSDNSARLVDPSGTSQLQFDVANEYLARDLGNGDVFIGTQDPSGNGLLPGNLGSRYPVLGSHGTNLYTAIGGVYSGYFHTGGYVGNSDERMKTDIQDLGDGDFRDVLAQLDSIRSARFRYKQEVAMARMKTGVQEEAPLHIGVIAQSLPPGVQVYDQRLDLYGVSMSDLAGFTLAAIRGVRAEEREKAARQDAVIQRQQEEIKALKKLVCLDHPNAAICR